MRLHAPLLLAAALLLGACATAPESAPVWHDEAFAPPSVAVDPEAVFALSPAMRHYLDTEIARRTGSRGKQRALTVALYERGELSLEYDSEITRNAAEAFDARAGNCLSLVIMTAAFAKALAVPVTYRSIPSAGSWTRVGDLLVFNGHVNVTLGHRERDRHAMFASESLVVDFLPSDQAARLRAMPVRERTIVAMYMNNRAAESLMQGRVDDAYWYAREAIHQDPGFATAYNTLGVVYLRHGQAAWAERALGHALALESGNPRALANLAAAQEAQGRTDEAQRTRLALARSEPQAPMHDFEIGRAAAQRGDWRAARDAFQRELRRNDQSAEVHHWLAVAQWQLGDVDAARRELGEALRNSTSAAERKRYAAKLAGLAKRAEAR
jgi:Flp pilus assembly protein TadD